MEFLHNHIYLIKDTPYEKTRIDITSKEYRIMVVPSDCKQPCHVDKEDVKRLLQRRECGVCPSKICANSPAYIKPE